MEYKAIAVAQKAEDDRTVAGFAAITGNVDSGGDIIHSGAFAKTLQEGTGRVKHLWMHDPFKPPVAKIVDLAEVGKSDLPDEVLEQFPTASGGLRVVRRYLETPRGEEILQGVKTGAISEMSIGYDAIKFDFENVGQDATRMTVRNLREVRLWDTSDVTWGMNAATVASAKTATVPYKDYGKADLAQEWTDPTVDEFSDAIDADGFGKLAINEKQRILAHFAWTSNASLESFADMQMPHHAPSKTGVGPVVLDGVKKAMNTLMSPEGSNIPEVVRKAAYDHLAAHYNEFGETAPEYKIVQLVFAANAVQLHGKKAGRVLSASNLDRLKEALAVLQDILQAAEPPEDPAKTAALTEQVLLRLAIAERDPILMSVR